MSDVPDILVELRAVGDLHQRTALIIQRLRKAFLDDCDLVGYSKAEALEMLAATEAGDND
jgi:hypothetical protein